MKSFNLSAINVANILVLSLMTGITFILYTETHQADFQLLFQNQCLQAMACKYDVSKYFYYNRLKNGFTDLWFVILN